MQYLTIDGARFPVFGHKNGPWFAVQDIATVLECSVGKVHKSYHHHKAKYTPDETRVIQARPDKEAAVRPHRLFSKAGLIRLIFLTSHNPVAARLRDQFLDQFCQDCDAQVDVTLAQGNAIGAISGGNIEISTKAPEHNNSCAHMREIILKHNPLWADHIRYSNMGLSAFEISRLQQIPINEVHEANSALRELGFNLPSLDGAEVANCVEALPEISKNWDPFDQD